MRTEDIGGGGLRPHLLFLDFETRSTVDIGKCGSFKYIEDPSFDVLLLAYAWDDEPVKLVDFAQGETWPEDFLQGLRDPDVTCIAHNCAFERAVIGKLLEYTPPEHWFDTMHLTAHCGLPLGLDGACKALGLPEDQAKMKEGKALIRYFCTPPKATKTNGGRPWNLPEHAPEKWDTFRRYCAQDVNSMRTIFNLLKRWLPDETERRIWALDARINENGMRADIPFVQHAMEMDGKYKAELTEQAIAVSGIENPNSVQQVKDWLKDQEDIEVPSLNKKEVADVIASLKTDRAKQLMEIRSELSKTSTKKYDAFIRCAGEDDHVRGCFQFFGAHSGRWSGRLVQLQNLKQNHLPDLDDARELVKTGDFECFEMLYPNVTGTLSELIRTSLIAEPGEQFVVSDFSAIEARVSAWFAHEEWVLDVFRNGGDIYCDTASQMFKVPVVKNGENGHLRQKGKVAILACIAEGELVLTDTGLVPIENVTTAMKVWDGENWVTHEGLIYKGEREVITYDGLTATPDHLVWVEGEQRPIQLGVAASCGARLVQTGDGRNPIRLGRGYQPGETVEQDLESLLCPDEVRGMRGRSMAEPDEPAARCVEGMPEMLTAEGTTEVVRQETNCRKTEMREPKRRQLRPVRGAGNPIRFSECESCRDVPDRKLWNPGQGTGDGPHRYEWELRPGKYPIRNDEGERSEQAMHRSDRMGPTVLALCVHNSDPKTVLRDDEGRDHPGRRDCGVREAKELERDQGKVRVYDLRNAGPNHRFTVSGRLVHNCGYGGGVNALKAFGADKMGMTNEEMAQTVDLWRKANPSICAMWKSLETAMKKCIVHKATTVDKIGGVRFRWEKGIVWMRLPSGREMAYYGAEYGESRFKNGMTLSYLGIDSKKNFTRIETWGGRVFENCVQATARDCLRDTMLRLDADGWDIRGHIHDEVICSEPINGRGVEEMCEVFARPIDWAPGLPLTGAGYTTPYYMKD